MIKVVTVEQMRAVEAATDKAGVSYAQMMQNAGRGLARVIMSLYNREDEDVRIAVLVGPGNNGGDGLVAARILKQETRAQVGAYLVRPRGDDDPVFVAARDAGVFIADAEADSRWRVLSNLVSSADILVDALLGTGARLPVEGTIQKVLTQAAKYLEKLPYGVEEEKLWLIEPALPTPRGSRHATVVAVDCPSGLDCDTGMLDPVAIPADLTVTFAAVKTGQLRFPGAQAVGSLFVADIGTPADLPELSAATLEMVTGSDVIDMLPTRPMNAHKTTFGRALLVGGSTNYVGAMGLAGEAAYRVGAGLVRMAVPGSVYEALSARLLEATWLILPSDLGVIEADALPLIAEETQRTSAILVGPGMGQDDTTQAFMRALLMGDRTAGRGRVGFATHSTLTHQPSGSLLPERLVIDADGLNLLAGIEDWPALVPRGTILTPHPGEMARLTAMETADIQADRVGIAVQKAVEWTCNIVLKGAFTVVASPEGRVVVLPFATDALATAGTGDVLAGCITGLLAQGSDPFSAAVAGAYLHGLAGVLAGESYTSRSTTAGDVLHALPEALSLVIET